MLFDRVASQYNTMSKQQKKVADYLRICPQDFIEYSSHELEGRVGVSAATIVRFVKHLGYSGVGELRVYIAQQIRHDETNVDLVVAPKDNGRSLKLKITQLYESATEGLRESVDDDELDVAIKLLSKAKRIYLLGVGTSGLVAYDMYHRLNRYGKTAFYDTDTHMGLEFITQSRPKDVALAISYSGMTKEVVLGAKQARKNGVPVISILANEDSPLAKLTDTPLYVPQTEHLVRLSALTSRVNAQIVTDILFSGVVKDNPEEVRRATVESNKLVTKLKE